MRSPSENDHIIGRNIKSIRNMCNLSQSELANFIGVSFQQIQKYEKGINRVSAYRLYLISKKLNIPIMRFYEGVDDETARLTVSS